MVTVCRGRIRLITWACGMTCRVERCFHYEIFPHVKYTDTKRRIQTSPERPALTSAHA